MPDNQTQVLYSSRHHQYMIHLDLDADEAEALAYALGMQDTGATELLEAADKARSLNEEARAQVKALADQSKFYETHDRTAPVVPEEE